MQKLIGKNILKNMWLEMLSQMQFVMAGCSSFHAKFADAKKHKHITTITISPLM